jgi:RHS repeat-associated protein
VGNRTQVVEVDGSVVTWSYDPTYQLTNEQRSGANSYNVTYAYDSVGNRTLLVSTGAPTTYTYNAGNELSTSQASAGITTYTFDGDGNLRTTLAPGSQSATNTWDGENRLATVALPSGIVNTFTYNADGQRIGKQDSTGTTNHVWDGQNVVLETNASNLIQAVYTLDPLLYGNLVSQSRGAVDSFYLFDALGSTAQLTDGTGAATDSYLYDAFGDNVSVTGSTTNSSRYVGRSGYFLTPDPSIYSARARYYSPATGRFLSTDQPLIRNSRQLSANPNNSYSYAENCPVILSDPSGRIPVCCTFTSSTWFGAPEMWSETVDCPGALTIPSLCCAAHGLGNLWSWKVFGSQAGACQSPPPTDPCAGNWSRLDVLDCMNCCFSAFGVDGLVYGAAGAVAGRIPKGHVAPGQWRTVNIWVKVSSRYGTQWTSRSVRVLSRAGLRVLWILGCVDFAVESACLAKCLSD